MTTAATTALTVDQIHGLPADLIIVDVRTPAEYASGHLPGAHNIPLDEITRATDALRTAAARGRLVMVCASGARSAQAAERLTAQGVPTATLTGGTQAWIQAGQPVERPEGAREVWDMGRQVRFVAGTLVLIGLLLSLVSPWFLILSGGIAAGLVYSGVSGTCGMAAMLAKCPWNRPGSAAPDLDSTLAALTR